MHGKRKAEEATRISVFPDDMTGVKVERGHQSGFQKKRREEKCNSSSGGSLQQHGSGIQMCPVQSSDGRPRCSSLFSVVPCDGRLPLDFPFPCWAPCSRTEAPPPAIRTNRTADRDILTLGKDRDLSYLVAFNVVFIVCLSANVIQTDIFTLWVVTGGRTRVFRPPPTPPPKPLFWG